jgi:hypothetical protein
LEPKKLNIEMLRWMAKSKGFTASTSMPQQEASGAAVDLISRVQRGPLERWLCRNMQLEELMSLLEQATVALPQAQPRSRQPRSDVDGVSEQHQHIQKRVSKLNQATLDHLAKVWSISVVEGANKYYDSLKSALIDHIQKSNDQRQMLDQLKNAKEAHTRKRARPSEAVVDELAAPAAPSSSLPGHLG